MKVAGRTQWTLVSAKDRPPKQKYVCILGRDLTMKLLKSALKLKTDESGAITVDWVVLTAAIVGLGIAVLAAVSTGVENLSNDIDTQLSGQGVAATF